MGQKVLIIGAVALGPKVACRLRRLDPSAHVTLIDRDNLISYGGCGIPYYVGGDVADLEGLYSTSSHAIRDDRFFETVKGVNVLSQTEVTDIDRKGKTVSVRNRATGEEKTLEYDKLVLATGANPVVPPIPGADLPGVSVVANLHNAKEIKEKISKGQVESAVVIGGGAIGVEMAEALADLWGVETTLVEMMEHLLPTAIGPDMGLIVKNHMEEHDVRILLGESVTQIVGTPETGVEGVKTNKRDIPCQLVVLAVGVRPNAVLAAKAGLAIGPHGGILVDNTLRTSDPNIFAGGDCIELTHFISGQKVPMAFGSLANREGRVIGTNIAGGNAQFKGSVGAFCLKAFEMGVASAGLTVAQAKDAGFDPVHAVVVQADRAHFYPTNQLMYMKLIADKTTRKVLGVEAVGHNGDAVKARVDAVSAVLPFGPDVSDITALEVTYAPPFASAMDIVNNAGNALDNILKGKNKPIDVADFLKLFDEAKAHVLDVRGKPESQPFVERFGDRWVNIPQDQLAARISEINGNGNGSGQLCLICDTGPRSYEAQCLLASHGITDTVNIQGGYGMLKKSAPDFNNPA
ncbi:FAD-dependent pyridine nucleotide-disulphide oxidoreductase [Desulfatibacillum aliphaticivorans]|uniref:FAD-dependent pyridine nucleotide-disulphide oxidoreductase n=1 Tax=Desulfatibacillum aliphaticivorans TaxID=218208 RepID=B8FN45_DESAL|nr:FAD-dependent oxidoreductase [Desulfatibacillum aliphaticivorans]ACL05915.1 FAD-dependent pyridine nucleotide-disulphide oxidoreductase [Desulfatibacillum aliphaticivorans]